MAIKKDIWGFGNKENAKNLGKIIVGGLSIIILANLFKNLFGSKQWTIKVKYYFIHLC